MKILKIRVRRKSHTGPSGTLGGSGNSAQSANGCNSSCGHSGSRVGVVKRPLR